MFTSALCYYFRMGRRAPDEKPRARLNFTVSPETIDMLDAIAYVEKSNRSRVLDEAVASYFEKKEAERGEPYPRR